MRELWCGVGETVVIGEFRLKIVAHADGILQFGLPGTAALLETMREDRAASNEPLPVEES